MTLPTLAVLLLTSGATERIAVMDVEVRPGVGADIGQTLSDDVVTEVRKRRAQATIIGADEIRSMVAMQGERQKLGCHSGDTACLAEIGGALGAEEMVTSTLGKLGKTYVFALKLVDVSHAKVVREASTKLRTKDEDDLLEAVTTLVAQLLPAQAAAPAPPPPAATPAPSPTPVPVAAISAPAPEPEKPHHSHVPAIAVGVAGLAAGGVAVFGLTQVLHYDGEVNTINTHGAGGQFTQQQLQSDRSSAQLWQPLGIGLTVLGVAGLAGAVILW